MKTNQAVTCALLMFLGANFASATNQIKIDMFAPQNFFTKNLIQSLIKSVQAPTSDPGVATFTQCPDDVGAFQLDSASSHVTPTPIQKGADATVNFQGIVTESIEVLNAHIHAEWNDSPLYDDDFKQDNTYDSTVDYSLTWNIPGFAPAGHYKVTVTGTGNSGSVQNGKVYCIIADFDL